MEGNGARSHCARVVRYWTGVHVCICCVSVCLCLCLYVCVCVCVCVCLHPKLNPNRNPDRNLEQVLPELFSDRFAFQDPDVKLKGIENYARACLCAYLTPT
jgi:hypothetical protein